MRLSVEISNNLGVNQIIKNRMMRKSNVMYHSIHIDPVYIVVSISINLVIPLNIRPSLLNQIMHVDICMIDDIVGKVITFRVRYCCCR